MGIDVRYDFGMTRILEVEIWPSPKAKKADWEGIGKQLQYLLEQKSSGNIPFHVKVNR